MPTLDSAVRQVGDFMVAALLLFNLTSVVVPFDLFSSSVGVEPSWFAGLATTALVALALLLARPLRLRLIACVWSIGLVVTTIWVPLLVFPELQGNPVGILVSWAAALGVDIALTYPPLWRAVETGLWVEGGAFDPGRARSESGRAILIRLGRLAIMSKCRIVVGPRSDDSDVNRSTRLVFTFGVAFVVMLLLGFISAPGPTDIAPLFLAAELTAVFGLPVYFRLSRAGGSESGKSAGPVNRRFWL